MNILNNKNKRTSIFKALALCLFAAISLTLVSCDDDMDIQQSYPFTVETMPVPNKVTKGQTVEIRCELKKTGDYANTLYTIRYFQFEGEGTLKMDNGITFLPTPGASFQDTSFAFKVIACADKAIYLHDAVLSYRQDNENSSVNSSAKVFCVNSEYAEIERWIREDYARDHASGDVARMLKFNQLIKYDSYMWNYVRLAPKFYKEFLMPMAKEFQAALDAGDFSLDDLKPWKRANLAAILKDPEGWVDEHPSFATDGALGRAKYYASVGGPGVVAAFLIESLRG